MTSRFKVSPHELTPSALAKRYGLSDEEKNRIGVYSPGDPVSDYPGRPAIQVSIILEERAVRKEQQNAQENLEHGEAPTAETEMKAA